MIIPILAQRRNEEKHVGTYLEGFGLAVLWVCNTFKFRFVFHAMPCLINFWNSKQPGPFLLNVDVW